ncbi:small heat shock protein [Gracilibacillus boraciitolerans JCM 21714]|uniref:Small heat shock protein n=1 Tax=Gracilibacillus boraciitolerans JCM 21714 TaxID=1298598 RepID=W4VNW0_9BACI|nr:Hsp20/alpha crystallin family protein [Gracilibacillus boraciitolerans]GAE94523.1 small heat shock protein [Gracilibacillus boraciitolerans JCM 21714]
MGGEDFIKKLDSFLYDKPTRNVMETIDSFFEQAKIPKQIPVDVVETDTEWMVQVDLPGLKKEQIELKLLGNQITIIVHHKEEKEKYDESFQYYRKERRQHRNQRTITLPYAVDKKSAKASFHNGVLEIKGPKSQTDTGSITID